MNSKLSRNTILIGGMAVVVLLLGFVLLIARYTHNVSPTAVTSAPGATVASSSSGASNVRDHPAWQTIPFDNVRTGQSMTLADFSGKTVVVEVISVWCANCLEQQKQAAEALDRLGDAAPVYISLDMDIAHPNDNAQTVVDYAAGTPFSWVFAFSNEQLTRALINEFGYNVLNAPITPIFVIAPDGTASRLYIGNQSADDLIQMIGASSQAA